MLNRDVNTQIAFALTFCDAADEIHVQCFLGDHTIY